MFRKRLPNLIRVCIAAGAILAVAVSTGKADEDLTDLRKLIDEQNKQIQELKQRVEKAEMLKVKHDANGAVNAGGTDGAKTADVTVRKIVTEYLQEKEQEKKDAKAKADDEGYGVGDNMNMIARWNPAGGRGLQFETPAKDYVIHFGGRVYEDFVFFNQSQLSNPKYYGTGKTGSPILPGFPTATTPTLGIGPYEDGTFFRRMRLTVDGTLSEVYEFFTEYEFEQTTPHNIVNIDQFWLGMKELPVIQNIRMGHVKLQQGFESLDNSRDLTFLERSPLFDSFDQEFVPGVWTFQDWFDQHMTTHEQIYRLNKGSDGLSLGDGLYGGCFRITALPLYEDQGRTLLHLGASYTYKVRTDSEATAALYPQTFAANNAIEFGTRISQRDAVGSSTDGVGTTGVGTNFIDTGILNGRDVQTVGGELFFIRGSFTLQAEYELGMVDDFRLPGTLPAPFAFQRAPDPMFYGYYVQAGYFLTGENRIYDRRTAATPVTYNSRILTPFWAVNDDSGHWNFGRGAWEVAFRYSFVNLDDKDVLGGKLNEYTFGLNWFPAQNFKVQFQYLIDQRNDLFPISVTSGLQTVGATAGQPIGGNGLRAFPSWVDSFGIRTVIDY